MDKKGHSEGLRQASHVQLVQTDMGRTLTLSNNELLSYVASLLKELPSLSYIFLQS